MNGIATELIFALGLAVDATYHSLIPNEEGNLSMKRLTLFGSYGTGIFINKSAMSIFCF
jgi:hypothetical protein